MNRRDVMTQVALAMAIAAAIGLTASPAAAQTQKPLTLSVQATQPAVQTPQTAAPQSTQAPPTTATGTLPVTMEQAVAMALENNLGLKSDRMDLDIAAHGVALARTAFLPNVQSTFGRTYSKSVPSDFTQGSSDITQGGLSVGASVAQRLQWYGSSYSLSWTGSRSNQTGGISSFNPHLGSGLRVNFTQPLWRGFRIDSARVGLVTSDMTREITDLQVQGRIVTTEASVRLAYLNLVASIENKKVTEQNLQITEQTLAQSKARVAVGQSPPIEIIQSEAQVASARVSVLQADVQIFTAEDQLRAMILDPSRIDYWTLRLVPTDAIEVSFRDINADAIIKNALANRLDLAAQKRQLDVTDLNLKLGKDNTQPAVDFTAGYSASGTAGTQFVYGSGFPPPIIDSTTRSFGGALGDTFIGLYPSWTFGVNVTYPIGRTQAEVSLAQSEIRRKQQVLTLQELQLEIVRQVRDAIRQVQNSYEQVQASKAFREAADRQLDAEQRRFANGLSTMLELQTRQRDFAQAKLSELSAMINYNRALINLDRVQKAQ